MWWFALVLAACGQAPVPAASVTKAAPPHVEPVSQGRSDAHSSVGFDRGLDLAFDNAPPFFAYVRGDEVVVFDHDRAAIDGQPRRSAYVRYRLGRAKALERLPIIDDELWRTWVEPPARATLDKLHQRATAVSGWIQGMKPLNKIFDWTKVPTKTMFDGHVVRATTREGDLQLELLAGTERIAVDEIKAFETTQQHQENEVWRPCRYDPSELAVYSDDTRVLAVVRYRYSIECDERDHAVRLWSIK